MSLIKKKLPIGIDDYQKLAEQEYIYIDKSLFIKEFWHDGSEVILITRPRRFGKTVTLSMVKYFFELSAISKKHLFEQSLIWKEQEFHKLQGTFPVIFISFKDVKKKTWESAYNQLKDLLATEIHRVIKPIEDSLSEYHKKKYFLLINKTANEAEFSNSLLFVTELLETYYQKKTIILIDEYDTPITYAYLHNYYNPITDFIRDLLSAGLKGNTHLQKGLLTGVVRTAKDSILSGLNNPKVCTVLKDSFSDKFGFTQQEVDDLLARTGLLEKSEEIKLSYNGYAVGAQHLATPLQSLTCSVYNPWSVINYIDNQGTFDLYWAGTGSTELLEKFISEASENIQNELKLLLSGKALLNKEIDEGVIFLNLDTRKQEPWSFLLFTGYLTIIDHTFVNNTHYYTLAIPNIEIGKLYQKLVLTATNKNFHSANLSILLDALIGGDGPVVNKLLQEFVCNMCSSHDLPKNELERSLHLFVLGLLASLSDRYIVKSNLESGYGRYDIMLFPKRPEDPGVILEFKRAASKKLDTLTDAALEQIREMKYEASLREFGCKAPILCYGIASFKKELALKLEIIPEVDL
jgi:hypothetical protein